MIFCPEHDQWKDIRGSRWCVGRWWDGTKPLVSMPLGYCDEVDRPLPSDDARWSCAVRFLVGWEPRRERLLHAFAASGVDVKIWVDTGIF